MTDLEKLKELLEAATPGPWDHDTMPDDYDGGGSKGFCEVFLKRDTETIIASVNRFLAGSANAALITEAVNTLPALIAELEAAREVVEAANRMVNNEGWGCQRYMDDQVYADGYELKDALTNYQEQGK